MKSVVFLQFYLLHEGSANNGVIFFISGGGYLSSRWKQLTYRKIVIDNWVRE